MTKELQHALSSPYRPTADLDGFRETAAADLTAECPGRDPEDGSDFVIAEHLKFIAMCASGGLLARCCRAIRVQPCVCTDLS